MADVTLPSPTATGPLTTFTSGLVKHLAQEVAVFRDLRHRLDHEDLSDVELRLQLGRIFEASLDGYAIARGFHESIQRLECDGDVSVAAMTGDDSVVAVMSGWIADQQLAGDMVATDLVAIEALIGVIEHRNELDGPTAAAFESIRSLAYSAIDRLDEARVPGPVAADDSRYGDLS